MILFNLKKLISLILVYQKYIYKLLSFKDMICLFETEFLLNWVKNIFKKIKLIIKMSLNQKLKIRETLMTWILKKKLSRRKISCEKVNDF